MRRNLVLLTLMLPLLHRLRTVWSDIAVIRQAGKGHENYWQQHAPPSILIQDGGDIPTVVQRWQILNWVCERHGDGQQHLHAEEPRERCVLQLGKMDAWEELELDDSRNE